MSTPKSIVVIEPNNFHYGLIEKALLPTYGLKRAKSWDEAAAFLKKSPHLVLTENPPDDLAWLTRMSRLYPQTPLVVLSTLSDDRRMIEAIQRGASDYWVKNRDTLENLKIKIRHALGRKKTRVKNPLTHGGNIEKLLGNLSRLTDLVNESGRKFIAKNPRVMDELNGLKDLLKKLPLPL